MVDSPRVARVIVVVMDGLRADAPFLFDLPHLQRIARGGAASFSAQTVSPSVTAAAMGSLLTGVRPIDHGLVTDRFRVPRPRVALQPLPRLLHAHGIATHAFLAALPLGYGVVARRLAAMVGVVNARFRGAGAMEILAEAQRTLSRERSGLFLLHWPDADRAGHADGWTSRAYAVAVRRMDEALGKLDDATAASADRDTLLVLMADHGGGGTLFRDHSSTHPRDRTIPLVLAGGTVLAGELAPLSSLLDVPATIAWSMGVGAPPDYAGRALVEAFDTAPTDVMEPAQRYASVAGR